MNRALGASWNRGMIAVLLTLIVALAPGFALAAHWQSVPLPGVESNDAPALEDFRGRLYIAVSALDGDYENPNDPIAVTSAKADGSNISTWTSVPGLTTASGPALKIFKNRLYLAVRGPDDRVYLATSKNGTTWTAWQPVPNSVATEAPALKVYKQRLYLAARGSDGAIAITSTSNGTSWKPWVAVPDSATPFAPALTVLNNRLTLGFTGPDQNIYLTTSNNGTTWSSQIRVPALPLGGEEGATQLFTNVGPGLTVLDGRLYVSARVGDFDTEDTLYLISYDDGVWNPWENVGRSIEGTATLTTFNDRLYIGTRYWDSTNLTLLFH